MFNNTDAVKALLEKAYEEAKARCIDDVRRMMREYPIAKAAVEAGVDRETIAEVAMKDGDVMAWLLATIPEYAKEKGQVRGFLASTAALAPLSREFVRVLPCAG